MTLARKVGFLWWITGQAIDSSGTPAFGTTPRHLTVERNVHPFAVGDGTFGFAYRPEGHKVDLLFTLFSSQGDELHTKKLRTGQHWGEEYTDGSTDLAGNFSLLSSVYSHKSRGNIYLNTWKVKDSPKMNNTR